MCSMCKPSKIKLAKVMDLVAGDKFYTKNGQPLTVVKVRYLHGVSLDGRPGLYEIVVKEKYLSDNLFAYGGYLVGLVSA